MTHENFSQLADILRRFIKPVEVQQPSSKYEIITSYIKEVAQELNIPSFVTDVAVNLILPHVSHLPKYRFVSNKAIGLAVLYVATKYSCYFKEILEKIANFERREYTVKKSFVLNIAREIEKMLNLDINVLHEVCVEKLRIICREKQLNENEVLELYMKAREKGEYPSRALIKALVKTNKLMTKEIADLMRSSRTFVFLVSKER